MVIHIIVIQGGYIEASGRKGKPRSLGRRTLIRCNNRQDIRMAEKKLAMHYVNNAPDVPYCDHNLVLNQTCCSSPRSQPCAHWIRPGPPSLYMLDQALLPHPQPLVCQQDPSFKTLLCGLQDLEIWQLRSDGSDNCHCDSYLLTPFTNFQALGITQLHGLDLACAWVTLD